jgi:hypothetical protein
MPPAELRRLHVHPSRILVKTVRILAYGTALLVLFLGGLAIIDRVVRGHKVSTTGFDTDSSQTTIRTLELFPYDGFHVQANFHHRGPLPWNDYTPEADFDIRTGDKGYFIDFSLEYPPPKAANEFRIILIGGSGAQGWGATRNENMFYSRVEKLLKQRLASRNIQVRVINLAMASSMTYQNYIALNRWGHTLEPDLILAYIGRNDYMVPLVHEGGSDAYYAFDDLDMFSLALREGEYPKGMTWLMDLMPNLMRHTSIGIGIKIAWGWDYFRSRARESYALAGGQRPALGRHVMEARVIPLLVHSLRSIKRDFDGVPIMVAWQPVKKNTPGLKEALGPDFYDRMYERTRGELEGYMNSRWFFVNAHQFGRTMPQMNFDVHLDDKAHEITGYFLADQIDMVMPLLLADRAQRLAQGLPSGYGRMAVRNR